MGRSKHKHYFKDVTRLTEVDVYRVCDLFQIDDPSGATQHAVKKLLLPGQRGAGKSTIKDLQEAVDTIQRRIEMLKEDGQCESQDMSSEATSISCSSQPIQSSLPFMTTESN